MADNATIMTPEELDLQQRRLDFQRFRLLNTRMWQEKKASKERQMKSPLI